MKYKVRVMHGLTRCPEYRVWGSMVERCRNPRNAQFQAYGGRGIKVCKRWQSFINFYTDMGLRPSKLHMIERRNNNRGYSPSNCHWALRAEQVRNKRNNRKLTAKGRTMIMADWARELGCNPAAILYRLKKGWSEEKAVTEPIPERPNSKLRPPEVIAIRAAYPEKSMQRIADEFHVSLKTIFNIVHGRIFIDVIV